MIHFDQFEHASLTDVGVRRSHNQDNHATLAAGDQERWEKVGHLFVVADGMGAHAVGEKASELAALVIPHIYQKHAEQGTVRALRTALREANNSIHECGQRNREFEGMGTTGTALVLRPEGAWIAHVGDSRIYRIREGWIEQLTFDHSLVWEYARIKKIDPAKVKDIPSNVIHRCLGPEPSVEVDLEGPYPLSPGDVFLMCSDGLSGQVEDAEIASVVSVLPPQEACRFLVDLANLRGGPDNITVIVVRVKGDPGGNGRRSAPVPLPAAREWSLPWWLPTLFAGAVFAAVAVFLRWTGLPGVQLALLAALGAVVVGIVGMLIHHQREKNQPDDDDDSTEPRIHRRSPFAVAQALIDRIRKLLKSLRDQAEERHWELDWEAHRQHYEEAEQMAEQGDLAAALREYCRAMFPLNRAFDRFRAKNEVFKPTWDEPQRG